MPLTVVIVPVIVGGWSVLSPLAAAAAAGLGFKLIRKTETLKADQTTKEVELVDDKSQIISESLGPEEELVFAKEGVTLTIKKDVREKITILVQGRNKANEELTQIGKVFLHKIRQQYAYQKIKKEITKRGFNIIQEQVEDNKIKILLRKF